jgi:hypothetical protein
VIFLSFNIPSILSKIHSKTLRGHRQETVNNVHKFVKRETERKIKEVILPKFYNEL